MSTIKIVEGSMVAEGRRFAVVAARFNAFVVEHLVAGALDTLKRHGAREEDLVIVRVPGAFEMPVIVQALAQSKRYDAIIALGAVIRGATPHFDYVAGECAKGLGKAASDSLVPVAFGVLTVDSIEQAIERAGTKAGNKGAEAALTAIEMANLMRELHG